jgi:hypothetical protein
VRPAQSRGPDPGGTFIPGLVEPGVVVMRPVASTAGGVGCIAPVVLEDVVGCALAANAPRDSAATSAFSCQCFMLPPLRFVDRCAPGRARDFTIRKGASRVPFIAPRAVTKAKARLLSEAV